MNFPYCEQSASGVENECPYKNQCDKENRECPKTITECINYNKFQRLSVQQAEGLERLVKEYGWRKIKINHQR